MYACALRVVMFRYKKSVSFTPFRYIISDTHFGFTEQISLIDTCPDVGLHQKSAGTIRSKLMKVLVKKSGELLQ
jgi:hypothetical protein